MNIRIAIVAVVCLATHARANAQPVETHRATVSYADLDLRTERGRERLYERVKAAAERVCGKPPLTSPLWLPRLDRDCVFDAIRRAEPAITAAHAIQIASK